MVQSHFSAISTAETFKTADNSKRNVRFGDSSSGFNPSTTRDAIIQQNDASPKSGPKSIGSSVILERNAKSGINSKGLVTGSVRLVRRKSSVLLDGSKSNVEQNDDDNLQRIPGFVDGNFSSGKVLDLEVDRCFVMAFQNTGRERSEFNCNIPSSNNVAPTLLAVGTSKGVAIYETSCYVLVHKVPRKGMVSAITWIPSPHREEHNKRQQYSLLGIADLDGLVSLYSIDANILESQGPTLIHEYKVGDQVRAMDCCYFTTTESVTLLMTVGDKSGNVTFCSIQFKNIKSEHFNTLLVDQTDTIVEQNYNSPVLGLSIAKSKGLIATCTKGGQVYVYILNQQSSGIMYIEKLVWETTRSGPVRCVIFSDDETQLCFGGYDKTVVFVETEFWVRSRELHMNGTVNTIAFDPQCRYLGVGCRDKSFTLFDTSTYVAVKTFHTTSWVTSVSWGPNTHNMHNIGEQHDFVTIRSDNTCVSVLDLTPTSMTDIHLSSIGGENSSISWNVDGTLIARTVGTLVVVSDPLEQFRDVWSFEMKGAVTYIAFCPASGKESWLAVIDECGYIVMHQLQFDKSGDLVSTENKSAFVAPHLNALAWDIDGTSIATGGRDKNLYIYNCDNLQLVQDPIKLGGRVWGIDYVPKCNRTVGSNLLIAVALGDYTTIILNDKFEPALEIQRSRTCRCLSFNPIQPILAIGDGAGSVTIVDYADEEIVRELDVLGRVNTVKYSSAGDFLVIGTDDSRFSIIETATYRSLQEIPTKGFSLSASFSPTGLYLALGSANESYNILRLGPFLAINLIPLTLAGGVEQIPAWALKEALFRSWEGPSFIQRHMINGEHDNLRRVASILRSHPNAIYTFNRLTNEGSFATAVKQKIPNLLKLAITTLVDGTLAPKSDEEKNFLMTDIPQQGRAILADIVKNYPADFAVDVFRAISFMKVPFGSPKVVQNGSRLETSSFSYVDPWIEESKLGHYLIKSNSNLALGRQSRDFISRTPAVLPLPGLGDMEFLASLLMYAPLEVFENEAMAVVVRVVWYKHIRKFFLLDCAIFAIYYISWVTLVELTYTTEDVYAFNEKSALNWMALVTATFNTLFAIKEMMQSRLGNREMYLKSMWNAIDVSSIICVYVYTLSVLISSIKPASKVPLAVITSLLLTFKVLAYLRGFADTGWLISVLIANFRDVRGYLFILLVILLGFSVSFRALFAESNSEAYGTLRQSLMSTFQLTLTSQYDPQMISEADHQVLASISFVLAVTGVLVVALNALISILADSYARVQQNAVANRRREVAALIVEYMSLLTPWKRKEIEHKTKWFHTLLEVDADGSLQVQTDDWEGGLNALRHDIQTMVDANRDANQRAIQEMKVELDTEMSRFKKEVLTILEGLTEDVKHLRKAQAQGIRLDGRNVVKAVQAVQAVGQKVGEHGGNFLKLAEGQAVKSMGQYRSKSISAFTRT